MTKRRSFAGSPASIKPASSPYKSEEHSTPSRYFDRSATYASRLIASFPRSKFRDSPTLRWGRGSGGGARGFVSITSTSAPGALTPIQAFGFSTENWKHSSSAKAKPVCGPQPHLAKSKRDNVGVAAAALASTPPTAFIGVEGQVFTIVNGGDAAAVRSKQLDEPTCSRRPVLVTVQNRREIGLDRRRARARG